ncbi:MAG: cysteine peptidase family C39 domain-containing protein [Gemmatimonadales bacterium]|nr:cysteine peptidase family C39 domain-containing protein [Gemmatimonadales bacterium]MDZ4390235.1 cysteine peptidase family C39 domain-containing protein [Gemmatimonadales bacterium]
MSPITRLVTAGLGVMIAVGNGVGVAQSPPSALSTASRVVLEVPYLPQSVLLCGGAAVAMVERWWGRRGVYAEDFGALVRHDRGGILTTELDSATRARGWDTQAFRGTANLIQQSLRDSIPVVALIESGRDEYHYVVVLAWSDGTVVIHDPAIAPFMTIDESTFLARWSVADRWALVIRPILNPTPSPVAPVEPSAPLPTTAPLPCAPWIDAALDAVTAGQLDAADRMLAAGSAACPQEPLILREMAAVRFKQGRHADAIALVTRYLEIVPDDALAWQLLATSRYLTGDEDGALSAWNKIGRPTVDLLRIDGTRAIRFGQIADAISVPHATVLTPSRLALARRRVADVPALRFSSVHYQPVGGGLVEVRAAVVERPVMPPAWRLAAAGLIGVARSEVGLKVASPTGGGELWSAFYRWETARPRVAFRSDIPVDMFFPGVIGMESAWERVRFALDTANAEVVEDSRRSASAEFGGWITPGVRPSAGVRVERWADKRDFLVMSTGAELRSRDDRFMLTVVGEQAAALSAPASYTRGGVRAMWTSSPGLGQAAVSTRLGADWVSSQAPLGIWPVTGSDISWAIPLRAEPGIGGGALKGRTAGRGIFHAGLAGDHPIHRVGPFILVVGVFLDGARVISAADGLGNDRFYLDGGGGIRIGIAEGDLGVLRIDVGRGLLDGRSALSVGVHRTWPLFQRRSR